MVAFKWRPDPQFVDAVDIVGAGGAVQSLSLIWRYRDAEELRAWFEAIPADKLLVDVLYDEVILGWGGEVQGPDGALIDYSREAFAALLRHYPHAALSIYEAYPHKCAGERQKNS